MFAKSQKLARAVDGDDDAQQQQQQGDDAAAAIAGRHFPPSPQTTAPVLITIEFIVFKESLKV